MQRSSSLNKHEPLPAIQSPTPTVEKKTATDEPTKVDPVADKNPPTIADAAQDSKAAEKPTADESKPAPQPAVPTQMELFAKLRELPLEEVIGEVETRVRSLKALDKYSTDDCVEDLKYLSAATRCCSNIEERERLGHKMMTLGIAELFQRVWKLHSDDNYVSKETDPLYQNLSNMMVVMWNMTDKSTALCEHSLNVGVHVDALKYMKAVDPEQTSVYRNSRVVKGMGGILHNMLYRVAAARQPIRDEDGVNIFQLFRGCTDPMIACKSLILQAFVINEDENEAVNSDESTFLFIHKLLSGALQGAEHRSKASGFSADELVAAVNKLAANDGNKRRIVKSGFLPLYVRLLEPDSSVSELVEATQGLWILAFKCREDIVNEPGCLEGLRRLAESSTEEAVTSQARGALWILEGKEQQAHAAFSADMLATVTDEKAVGSSRGHIFISYQWDSKPTILMIRDRLRENGLNIWVDVDNMSGSVLEAMAEAVEKAAVVLVCLTQKYKESPNCRTEAEYTFRLHKPIIPLRLEPRYYPDGWLGALCGNNLIYDFSLPAKHEDSFAGLLNGLARYAHNDTGGSKEKRVERSSVTGTQLQATHERSVDVTRWRPTDIDTWLQSNDLNHLSHW